MFTVQLSLEIRFHEVTIILTTIYLIVDFDHIYAQNFYMIVSQDLNDGDDGDGDANY